MKEDVYVIYCGRKVKLPDWVHLSIEQQIATQVAKTVREFPHYHCMVCYTYDHNRPDKLQKHYVSI